MQRWAQKQTGFTIVELLIVIVVIAILATITIVAYTGIQQRAKDSAILATVDSWEKALQVAVANGAALPPTGACLGRTGDFPARDGFAAGQCLLIDDAPAAGLSFSDSHYSTWTTTQRPIGTMPVVTFKHSAGVTFKGRGIWIGSTNAVRTELRWVAQIDGSCARGVPGDASVQGSLTGGYCVVTVFW